MPHTRARAHALNFACTDDGSRPHTVLVFERSIENVSDDFHISMTMRRKSFSWRHTIFVDHPQRAETHILRVVVRIEGKRVVRVQPAVIRVAAFISLPN